MAETNEKSKWIPLNEVSYKDVAKRVGVPRDWKAVGNLLDKSKNQRSFREVRPPRNCMQDFRRSDL
jgi:alkylated DNA nucleotide flippase Atl1